MIKKKICNEKIFKDKNRAIFGNKACEREN